MSDVGGNPLRYPTLSHQMLVRSCFRYSTLILSSIVENTSILCLFSMNGDKSLDYFPSYSFSLLTNLLLCGAICTWPEGAIETTSVSLVGELCLSTSLVTMSQLSKFFLKTLSTHSNFVLNSLLTSYEDLSCWVLVAIVLFQLFSGGYLISSWFCNP